MKRLKAERVVWSAHSNAKPAHPTHFEAEAIHGKPIVLALYNFPIQSMLPEICGVLDKECLFGGKFETAAKAKQSLLQFTAFIRFIIEIMPPFKNSIESISINHITEYERYLAKKHSDSPNGANYINGLLEFLRAASNWLSLDSAVLARLKRGAVFIVRSRSAAPTEPFSPAVEEQLLKAALEAISKAEERLVKLGPGLLARGRDPECFGWDAPENILWHIHHRGPITRHDPRLSREGRKILPTINDLAFLNVVDAAAFIIVISLETGLPIESVLNLRKDCLRNEFAGSTGLLYHKGRRTRTQERISMRFPVGDKYSTVHCIKILTQITESIRRFAPNHLRDHIFLGVGNYAKVRHISSNQPTVAFLRHYDVRNDDGQRIKKFNQRRLRKTKVVSDYIASPKNAHVTAQNTAKVHALHYASVDALIELHEETITTALNDAYTHAIDIRPSEAEVEGDDIGVATCQDARNPPHDFKNSDNLCDIPVWGCLLCKNSIVTASHLPAILMLLAEIQDQRQRISLEMWTGRYGVLHARITRTILPAFSPSEVVKARIAISNDGLSLWLPPERTAMR